MSLIALSSHATVRASVAVLAAWQLVSQLAVQWVGLFAPDIVQIVACICLPLLFMLFMPSGGNRRRRPSSRVGRERPVERRAIPDRKQITGLARVHCMLLLFTAGLCSVVIEAVSVHIWGGHGQYYFWGVANPVLSNAAACLLMAVAVVLTLVPHLDKPISFRYQVPFLVVIAGYMLAFARWLCPSALDEAVTSALVGIGYFSKVFAWTVFVSAARSVDVPPGRSAGVLLVGSYSFSLLWVGLLEDNAPVAGLVVLLCVYVVIIVIAVHPRLLYERVSKKAVTDSELNEYAIDGEPRIPLAANGVVMGMAISERCGVMADRYGLSSREAEVLEQLLQGKTIAGACGSLSLSEGTAKMHVTHIYKKMGVHTRQGLVDLALNEHIR